MAIIGLVDSQTGRGVDAADLCGPGSRVDHKWEWDGTSTGWTSIAGGIGTPTAPWTPNVDAEGLKGAYFLHPLASENWTIEMDGTLLSPIQSYGAQITAHAARALGTVLYTVIVEFSGGTVGRILLRYGSGTGTTLKDDTATGLTFSAGDQLRITLSLRDRRLLRAQVRNMTTGVRASTVWMPTGAYGATVAPCQVYPGVLGASQSGLQITGFRARSDSRRGLDVILLADSISAGYYSDLYTGRAVEIARAAGVAAEVYGGPGEKLSTAVQALPEVALAAPRLVLIALGTNDINGGANQSTLMSRLAAITEGLTTAGIPWKVLTIPGAPGAYTAPTAAYNAAIIANYGTAAVDMRPLTVSGSGTLPAWMSSPDGIHLTAGAAQAMYGLALVDIARGGTP